MPPNAPGKDKLNDETRQLGFARTSPAPILFPTEEAICPCGSQEAHGHCQPSPLQCGYHHRSARTPARRLSGHAKDFSALTGDRSVDDGPPATDDVDAVIYLSHLLYVIPYLLLHLSICLYGTVPPMKNKRCSLMNLDCLHTRPT